MLAFRIINHGVNQVSFRIVFTIISDAVDTMHKVCGDEEILLLSDDHKLAYYNNHMYTVCQVELDETKDRFVKCYVDVRQQQSERLKLMRRKTNLPFMDCKKYLNDANWDLDEAIRLAMAEYWRTSPFIMSD